MYDLTTILTLLQYYITKLSKSNSLIFILSIISKVVFIPFFFHFIEYFIIDDIILLKNLISTISHLNIISLILLKDSFTILKDLIGLISFWVFSNIIFLPVQTIEDVN